jgi:CRP-like cAMP-binding protein
LTEVRGNFIVKKMSSHLELSLVNFKRGSLVAVEGQAGADRFFIIRQGRARIFRETEMRPGEGGGVRGPGDFFAVVSALSGHNHIESAEALTDLDLIAVRRDQYGEFIHAHPRVAMKINMDFSRRLRYLDKALSRLAPGSTEDEEPAQLVRVGDFYARQGKASLARYAYRRYLECCPGGRLAGAARERLEKMASGGSGGNSGAGSGVPGMEAVLPGGESGEPSRVYPRNSLLFAEGEPGEELFIIQKGAVKLSKIVDNHEVLIAVLRGGDIFGEMALIEKKPRAANAAAHEDCMVTVINRDNFARMIREQPQIIARLGILQAERIWYIYRRLSAAMIKDPLGRLYNILLIHLERSRVDLSEDRSFVFNLGPRELCDIAGFSWAEGEPLIRRLLENKKLSLVKDRFFALDVAEIARRGQWQGRQAALR